MEKSRPVSRRVSVRVSDAPDGVVSIRSLGAEPPRRCSMPINRFPILAALDADWRDFVRSPAAVEAVDRWRRSDVVLADLTCVEDVLALRRDVHRADEVLRALVERAPTDPVAGRVVLQSILPGLVRVACWYAAAD